MTLSHPAIARRTALGLIALWGLGAWMGAGATGPAAALPAPELLDEALTRALRAGEPLIVMVSLPGCAYCHTVREHHLVHLRAQGAHIVQIDLRDRRVFRDIDGQTLTQDDWARQRKVRIAPTVLFLGPQGREVARRLVGASIPDFYGSYLEEQYRLAKKAVNA